MADEAGAVQHVGHRRSDDIAQLNTRIRELEAERDRLRVALEPIVRALRMQESEAALNGETVPDDDWLRYALVHDARRLVQACEDAPPSKP